MLRRLGMQVSGNTYSVLNKRLAKHSCDTSHFQEVNTTAALKKIKIPFDEILVKESTYTCSSSLKRRLVKEGLLKNICASCPNQGEWQGKPLSLQLDHINGRRNDKPFTKSKITLS
jgi:hypothetical protein